VMGTPLPGVMVLQPKIVSDTRGYFLESYSQRSMVKVGIEETFVQDNHSFSTRNVIRGLHYQASHPQGKLVRVVSGEVFDVVVDLRKSSPTFGKWHGVRLSEENHYLLWIPPGLAHGFSVLSEQGAHLLYKATEFYNPESERTILWNDPDLSIAWQLEETPVISAKDNAGVRFRDAQKFL